MNERCSNSVRIAEVLLAEGCRQVAQATRNGRLLPRKKYRAFTRPDRPGYFWFLTDSGRLRTGATISGSFPAAQKRGECLTAEPVVEGSDTG